MAPEASSQVDEILLRAFSYDAVGGIGSAEEVVDLASLSGLIFLWHLENNWRLRERWQRGPSLRRHVAWSGGRRLQTEDNRLFAAGRRHRARASGVSLRRRFPVARCRT